MHRVKGLTRTCFSLCLFTQAVEASGAKRTVLHAAVEAESQNAVSALSAALPEDLLLKQSADGLTPIGALKIYMFI